MDEINKFIEVVYEYIDVANNTSEEEISEIIDEILFTDARFDSLSLVEKLKIKKDVFNKVKGLDILSNLLEDEEITEIMVNGYDKIFIEKNGKIVSIDDKFESESRLFEIIQRIMSNTNRVVNEASPIVDTRLDDGSRVNIVLSPISIKGSSITIRKFPKETMTIEKLIKYGSLDENIAKFLEYIVKAKYNIFISGQTSSGKTSMLNALSKLIPKDERIITIEDSAELNLDNIDNIVSLEVRNANVEGDNEITMRQLIKTALRMRPNRILVGEVRGEEAVEMLQAMNTGHSGSISTGHANSSQDMISRLETMVVMGVDIPLLAVRNQIASAIEIFIHLGRDSFGKRSLLEISEVVGCINGEIVLNKLYEKGKNGFEKVGEIKHRKEL